MKVIEQFGIPEPQWILDEAESGDRFWRRNNTGNNSRVKFRYDVEIKEFCRSEHELQEDYWSDNFQGANNILTMGMTCLLCVTVTVILPWYILLGPN